MDARKNPFSPGAGARPPALTGRDSIIDDVSIALDRIRSGRSAKSVLMVGLRGVGKTVLLNELKNNAEAVGLVCSQFEAEENSNLPAMIIPCLRSALLKLNRLKGAGDFVNKCVKTLGSFIGAMKLKYEDMEFGFDLGKEEGVADSGDLNYDLTELFQAVGEAAKEKNTAVVLFTDELQYVPTEQLSALISALHGCAQKQLPVVLVGAGLPQLVGNVGKAKSYAERLFSFPVIDRLSEEDVYKALQEPVKREDIEFDASAIEEIIKKTQGYPYFIQEWGSQSWNTASNEKGIITKNDVKQATHLALTELDRSFFRVRFDRCTPMEKHYMRAMAEIGSACPRSGEIAAVMKRSVSQVSPLRQSLIAKGMIYSPAHGDTAFTVPLFADYMRRTIKLSEMTEV